MAQGQSASGPIHQGLLALQETLALAFQVLDKKINSAMDIEESGCGKSL